MIQSAKRRARRAHSRVLYFFRDRYNAAAYGASAPRSCEILAINPSALSAADVGRQHVFRNKYATGLVVDGRSFAGVEVLPVLELPKVQHCIRRWREGRSWREAGAFSFYREMGFSDEEIERRHLRLDRIFAEVQGEGRLKTQAQLGRGAFREEGGIRIHIGERGECLFADGGAHRLAMALILGLETIPVQLGCIHEGGLQFLGGFRNLNALRPDRPKTSRCGAGGTPRGRPRDVPVGGDSRMAEPQLHGNVRGVPSTTARAAALGDVVRELVSGGEVAMQSAERASRNTEIVRGTCDGLAFIGKRSALCRGEKVAEAARTYQWLRQQTEGEETVSSPRLLAWDPSHEVIVLEYIDSPMFSTFLRDGTRDVLLQSAEIFGSALAWFHNLSRQPDGRCRLYMDFSPRNVLVDLPARKAIFIDAPDEHLVGRPEIDLGLALFEVTRAASRARCGFGLRNVKAVRRHVLAGYLAGVDVKDIDLQLVHAYERAHNRDVIGRYIPFWRYRDWAKQFLRAIVYVPATILIFCAIGSLLQRSDAEAVASLKP